MSVTSIAVTETGDRRTLSRAAAFGLQAGILITFMAASSAPTPLYGLYQTRWGFSSITLTAVFSCYAVALLITLLTVGSLSDHVGRRPVLFGALALEMLAMLAFVSADGVGLLYLARIVQGVATGAAMGVLGAGLLDLESRDRPGRGTLVNSVTPMIGLAAGGIGSSMLVQWVGSPTRVVYAVLLAILAIATVGVVFAPETSTPMRGALASLRPHIGIPPAARRAVFTGAPCAVAAWALGGLYLSLGPSLARLVVGWDSHLLGGLVVLTLAGSGAVAVLLLRGSSARVAMLVGTVGLTLGLAITLYGIVQTSGWAFFIGGVVSGAGFGSGFSGVLRMILPLAAPHERAELLASMYVISYLAFSVPAVVAGVFTEHVGLLSTARWYAVVVMVLAALALAGLLVPRRTTPQR